MSQNSGSDPWEYLEKRFGVDRDEMEGLQLEEVAGDYWLAPERPGTGLEVETRGLRFIRTTGRGLKPTTYALQFLGDRLEKNLVDVDREELRQLLARERMIPRKGLEKGYVGIMYEGKVIGCGYFMDGVVSSRVPKGRSRELLDII